MSKLRLLQESDEANKAWLAEIEVVFGAKEAALARYEGRATGEPGTPLRDLYDRQKKARGAYEAQCASAPPTPRTRYT